MIDELLKKYNVNRDDMSMDEIETLENWAKSLNSNELTIPILKNYIDQMVVSLQRELHGYETPKTWLHWFFRRKQYRHMEARLINYLLLVDFLSAPEKAKKFIENQIKQIR